MPFGDDDAFGQLDLAFGTDEGTSGRVFQISGLADYTFDAEAARVCHGDLNLCLLPAGA